MLGEKKILNVFLLVSKKKAVLSDQAKHSQALLSDKAKHSQAGLFDKAKHSISLDGVLRCSQENMQNFTCGNFSIAQ